MNRPGKHTMNCSSWQLRLASPPSKFGCEETLIGGRGHVHRISPPARKRVQGTAGTITMRDRSKNRKPTQRGRYLSIEAIQAVQALKRAGASGGGGSLERVMESKVRRLIKTDLVAVLRELQNQGEALLALQVFEEIRKEHWYKPRLSVYIDVIKVLASSDLHEQVEQICSYLKMESPNADSEDFDSLFKTLLEFGFVNLAMDCFRLMKLWDIEPDKSTYRILINGLDANRKLDLSNSIRQEAEEYFEGYLEFLDEKEETYSAKI